MPTSTYRFQLQPAFTLDDAAAQVPYLSRLGVTHAYLSPILTPTPGSEHGYDVVDHTRVNPEIGGDAALQRLVAALAEAGMGAVVDIVPNHMAVPTPLWHNAPLWRLLVEGPQSEYARWFDVDWAAGEGKVLMPVLGGSLEDALTNDELAFAPDGGADRDEPVIRYYDKEFPVRDDTADLPLVEMVAAQHYRLANWREATESLNYRRFFDVTELAAVRVEDPDVFDATHDLVSGLVRSGAVDGIRVDHPDGLADPAGYLRQLAVATGGAWVVVEKILEGEERLPASWACAGTTGYDALMRVGGLFVDPQGEAPLTELWQELTGETESLHDVVRAAKQRIVEKVQVPEVDRLVRLARVVRPDAGAGGLSRALQAVLVRMDRYRIYLEVGERDIQALEALDDLTRVALGDIDTSDRPSLELVRDLAGGRLLVGAGSRDTDENGTDENGTDEDGTDGDGTDDLSVAQLDAAREFLVRFQQTCGPVMAKGIEDTAFYRYHRFDALNEVGGDPDRFGVAPAEFHAYAAELHRDWPTTMTTLSTHDTKRSEDVRARLTVLAERPQAWADWVRASWDAATPHRSPRLDPVTEYFLWQTLVGAWPISPERLNAYALKAIREDKRFTVWTDQDEDYESAVREFLEGVVADPALVERIESWVSDTAEATRATTLGQKLIQLVMTGVPDVYQGTEVVDLSLVDPDNRRLVDYAARDERLAALDDGQAPVGLDDEKLLVTSRALRLRREHPEWFTGPSATITAIDSNTDHLVAIGRGTSAGELAAVAVVTRLSTTAGDLRDADLDLPVGRWTDLLSGATVEVGTEGLLWSELSTTLPVALLVRADA